MRKSGPQSISMVRPPYSTRADALRRASLGSDEVHTGQRQPIIGTPDDVPEPRIVSLAFIS